jgi:signal transduction histidine kinase
MTVQLLAEYGVYDRPERPELQSLAELAARVCQVPTAAVNLLDDSVQHQVAAVGLAPADCARSDSMCATTLGGGVPIVVPDARTDLRFARNPFVTGQIATVRFYAAVPLRAPDGTLFGTLCVFDSVPRDLDDQAVHWLDVLAEQVTGVLELERTSRRLGNAVAELEQARGELVRSNDQLAAFAGQVSHDLRGPLAAVIGFVEMLAKRPAVRDDGVASQYAELAVGSGRRMVTLLSDLLAHARVGGTLQLTTVDLGALVPEVVSDLGPLLAGVSVSSSALPSVRGDRTQLRAVLQNLLSNAAAYRRQDRPAVVSVSGSRTGSGWRVEVTDNGLGVPPEYREEAFDPLVRLHGESEAPAAVGNSGLGLATCRRIVAAHGGDIGLTDGIDGGTTAWFTLPA